jgi:hypothetical protein
MAAPTTLAQFWTNEVDGYTVLRSRVSGSLGAAQSTLQSIRTQLGDALGALAGAQKQLAAAKAALAAETDLDAQSKRLDRGALVRRDHLFSLVRGDI